MALLGLREAAHFAKGNRNNCLQLDALGQDILRVFDFHGACGDRMGSVLGFAERCRERASRTRYRNFSGSGAAGANSMLASIFGNI